MEDAYRLLVRLAVPPQVDGAALSSGLYSLHRVALGNREQFLAMNRAIENHQLRPVIEKVVSFENVREAFEYAFHREAVGKVVVRVA